MSSLQIKQGLSEFGYTDHYAILGLAVDTASGDVRKRYLKIARFLHPDSCPPDMDKAFASQVLSKLVNPSYQTLSQEKDRSEYSLLLKLVGQRANLELDLETVKSPKAQELSSAPNFEELYQKTVQELAENQYTDLEQLISHIEQLSELNLVFLLRRENPQFKSPASGATANSVTASVKFSAAPSPQPAAGNSPAFTSSSSTQTSEDFVRQYIRRAEDLKIAFKKRLKNCAMP
jgi:curved DNA-binding protein CbpA